MAIIELHTEHKGETARLLIDGRDVSRDAQAVTIRFDVHAYPRATVEIEYKADELHISGDHISMEDQREEIHALTEERNFLGQQLTEAHKEITRLREKHYRQAGNPSV